MQPRQMRETFRPVLPRLTYSIVASFRPGSLRGEGGVGQLEDCQVEAAPALEAHSSGNTCRSTGAIVSRRFRHGGHSMMAAAGVLPGAPCGLGISTVGTVSGNTTLTRVPPPWAPSPMATVAPWRLAIS